MTYFKTIKDAHQQQHSILAFPPNILYSFSTENIKRNPMPTDSQRRTLNFIQAYILRNGHAPTYPEITEGSGIKSIGTAHRYVKALIDQGYLINEEGSHRGLSLPEDTIEQGISIPLLGKIADGLPIEASSGSDRVNLNQMFGGDGRYALKVSGNSMIDLGILDGDTDIIQDCRNAPKNAIVVRIN